MIKLYLYILLNILGTNIHEFHLSKTDLHYKSEQESFQLSVHLFIDDFEVGLKDYSDEKMYLFDTKESIKADSLIGLYLKNNLNVEVDNQKLEFEFIGREMSEDLAGIWCYLEASNVEPFNNVKILNVLLTSKFDDQKNIINLKVDNKSKAFHILDKKDNFKEISFE